MEQNNKKYQIIYADPPWKFGDKLPGNRGAERKYDVMTQQQLFDMRAYIDEIADKDCLLAMWWVASMPKEALDLVDAWGFTFKTMKGFTWHKRTVKNNLSSFGMGRYTRQNTEDCLFATRGKPVIQSRSVRQFIDSTIRKHSQKPDEARDLLVELIGDVPRIELFARAKFDGWDYFGNQVE